ncbi:hypothetical protein N2152v2_011071 [Parachlorella kessleri]
METDMHLCRHRKQHVTGQQGWLPIHAAAARNDALALEALLGSCLRHLDSPCTSACGSAAIHLAAANGAVAALQVLLLAGADANLRRNGDGLTALHLASAAGDAAAVQLLLNSGADAAKAAPSGEAAMHFAAAGGHTEVVLCLAQQDGNLFTHSVAALGTPLHVLAAHGHAPALEALLAKPQLLPVAALELEDSLGRTPLTVACESGHTSTAQLLLSRLQQRLRPAALLAALVAACKAGQACLVQLLLQQPAASMLDWGTGSEEQHPALWAIRMGHAAALQALLAAGVSLPGTAFLEALRKGDGTLVDMLLRAGADPSGHPCCCEVWDWVLLRGRHALLAQLLGRGLDPQHPGAGRAPLLQAVVLGNLPAARLLLRHGADPNGSPTADGEAPLHAAARLLHHAALSMLLGAPGVDVRLRDSGGRTALDLVLARCTGAAVASLPTHSDLPPGCTAERRLLTTVEALAAAGCPYTAIPLDHHQPCPQLPFPSLLLLAASRCPWAPGRHTQWPASFRAAAREFLLAACAQLALVRARGLEGKPCAEGVVRPASTPVVSDSGARGEGAAAGARRRRVERLGALRGSSSVEQGSSVGPLAMLARSQQVHAQRRVCLPPEVCCLVLAAAGQRLSDWV